MAFVVLEREAEIMRSLLDVHVILDLESHVQVGVSIQIYKCRTSTAVVRVNNSDDFFSVLLAGSQPSIMQS